MELLKLEIKPEQFVIGEELKILYKHQEILRQWYIKNGGNVKILNDGVKVIRRRK